MLRMGRSFHAAHVLTGGGGEDADFDPPVDDGSDVNDDNHDFVDVALSDSESGCDDDDVAIPNFDFDLDMDCVQFPQSKKQDFRRFENSSLRDSAVTATRIDRKKTCIDRPEKSCISRWLRKDIICLP